jgi:hypothetical protein
VAGKHKFVKPANSGSNINFRPNDRNRSETTWAETVRTTVYIQNRIRDKVSAHERYFGTKLNLRHLRVFGSIAYEHIPKEKRKKPDAKAEKCTLLGYSDEQKGYKCYNPRTKQACVSHDVVFDESTS